MQRPTCWLECSCDHCESPNWICLGDLEDTTAQDISGFTCWACRRLMSLIPDGEDPEYFDENVVPGVLDPTKKDIR